MAEYGVAKFVLLGEGESGDQHLVCCNESGILITAIDGIGHGAEAANAAKAALTVLRNGIGEPIISLVMTCHEKLRATRGVVLSLASVDVKHGLMTWLGVGNVHGVLVHADKKWTQETLLLRAGVVGDHLPRLVEQFVVRDYPCLPNNDIFATQTCKCSRIRERNRPHKIGDRTR